MKQEVYEKVLEEIKKKKKKTKADKAKKGCKHDEDGKIAPPVQVIGAS
jgi:hypothetical protein